MNNELFEIVFIKGWDKHFSKFNKDTRNKIKKKIIQIQGPLQGRGLKKSKVLIEEE